MACNYSDHLRPTVKSSGGLAAVGYPGLLAFGLGVIISRMRNAVITLALVVLLGGCVSGQRGTDGDRAAPAPAMRTVSPAQRTAEIRRLYPHLSESQIAERVRDEFATVTSASRRQQDRVAEQRIFEDEVAAGRRVYDKAELGY